MPELSQARPPAPKFYAVPFREKESEPEPRRGWGWLALPGGMLLLAGFMAVVQRMREQQHELAASQLQLAQTQQAYFALQVKPAATVALEKQLAAQAEALKASHAKLKAAEDGLGKIKDQASAREQELQQLVAFLKEEVKASEAQVEQLKVLLKQRIEIKQAQ